MITPTALSHLELSIPACHTEHGRSITFSSLVDRRNSKTFDLRVANYKVWETSEAAFVVFGDPDLLMTLPSSFTYVRQHNLRMIGKGGRICSKIIGSDSRLAVARSALSRMMHAVNA